VSGTKNDTLGALNASSCSYRERHKSKTSKQVLSMPYLESIPLCSILDFISIRSTLERSIDSKRLLFHLLITSSLVELFSKLLIGLFRYLNDYSDCPHYPFLYVRTPFPNFYTLDLNSPTSERSNPPTDDHAPHPTLITPSSISNAPSSNHQLDVQATCTLKGGHVDF
jgi:hypothetical protein